MAHGYNPYRDHGRFAPGPHQELLNKEGRHRAIANKLGAQMEAVKARAAHATPAAKGELKKRYDKLAARQKTQKAGAEAAKAQRAAKAKPVGPELPAKSKVPRQRKSQAGPEQSNPLTPKRPPPSPTELTKAVGDGKIIGTEGWSAGLVVGLTPESQSRVRGYFNDVAAAYGLSPRRGPDQHALIGLPSESMGGAAGFHTWQDKIVVSHDAIHALSRYGGGDHAEIAKIVTDPHDNDHYGFSTYHTMMHETFHGHGPLVSYDTPHAVHLEEMTTEISARHASANVHGVAAHEIKSGTGYNEMIEGSVGHVARVAGVTREQAFDALAKASIEFKSSGTHSVDTEAARRGLAWNTLEHLGAVRVSKPLEGERKQRELLDGWHQEAVRLTEVSGKIDSSGI